MPPKLNITLLHSLVEASPTAKSEEILFGYVTFYIAVVYFNLGLANMDFRDIILYIRGSRNLQNILEIKQKGK